ncbi:hypothetical protein GCM10020219_046510 [Nonomuraea dietziae]
MQQNRTEQRTGATTFAGRLAGSEPMSTVDLSSSAFRAAPYRYAVAQFTCGASLGQLSPIDYEKTTGSLKSAA